MSTSVTSRERTSRNGTWGWQRDTVVLLGSGLVIIAILLRLPLFWALGIMLLVVGFVLAMSGHLRPQLRRQQSAALDGRPTPRAANRIQEEVGGKLKTKAGDIHR
jgi:hypothetical protein